MADLPIEKPFGLADFEAELAKIDAELQEAQYIVFAPQKGLFRFNLKDHRIIYDSAYGRPMLPSLREALVQTFPKMDIYDLCKQDRNIFDYSENQRIVPNDPEWIAKTKRKMLTFEYAQPGKKYSGTLYASSKISAAPKVQEDVVEINATPKPTKI